ncbi:hypothetical protein WA158_006750 [Blastocystis sp. Blastoise]
MSGVEAVCGIEDPRYEQAREKARNNDFEGSLALLSDLLEQTCQKYGELNIKTAPVYYRYGSILIERVNVETGGALSNAIEEDVKIAWENLEAARYIYEKSGSNKEELAQVLMRLGDVSLMNGNYETSVKDNKSSLKILKSIYPASSRPVGDSESAVAIALFYYAQDNCMIYSNMKEDMEENPEEEEVSAISMELYLTKAKEAMQESLSHFRESSRIFRFLVAEQAVEQHILDPTSADPNNITNDVLNVIVNNLSNIQDMKIQEDMQINLEIIHDLDDKINDCNNWTVQKELDKIEQENAELDGEMDEGEEEGDDDDEMDMEGDLEDTN